MAKDLAPRRILAVKLADMGDLLTATPALRALRLSFPSAHITALVTPPSAPVLRFSDAVDRVIPFDKFAFDRPANAIQSVPVALRLAATLRREHYDTVLVFHHLYTWWGVVKYAALAWSVGASTVAGLDNGRGWFLTHRAHDRGYGAVHEAEYWLEVAGTLGARHPSPTMELPVGQQEEALADTLWHRLGLEGHEVLAIHPGTGDFSPARRWSAERFAETARLLSRHLDARVALIAGPARGERRLAREIAGSVGPSAVVVDSLPSPIALAAFLKRCRLFVGNDSGVMHVASAVGVPVVAVFGPSNHRAWGPWPSKRDGLDCPVRVVRVELACSPCVYRGRSPGTPGGCPARTCLQLVTPDMVTEAAIGLMRSRER